MMTTFRPDRLLELTQRAAGLCVSLYLPTHRAGQETRQDRIRLGNLLRSARAQAEELGASKREIDEVLAPAQPLLGDDELWKHPGDGLAVLLAPEVEVAYPAPIPLPELVVVADRLHVKPLLPLLAKDARFLVLAISRNSVRLLEGTRFAVRELDAGGLPKSLADALWTDDPEKSLQLHTSGRSTAAGGRTPVMFHGQGTNDDVEKTNLLRYFRSVDRGLHDYVADGDAPPLVLACVEYYLPIFREASTYPALHDGGVVAGNPEHLSAEDIRARGWELLAPRLLAEEKNAEARFGEGAGTGLASADLGEICTAAQNARVAELFVALDANAWGRPPQDAAGAPSQHETQRPGDVDLLDFAAVCTLQNGGAVFPRAGGEVPGDGLAAAVFRY